MPKLFTEPNDCPICHAQWMPYEDPDMLGVDLSVKHFRCQTCLFYLARVDGGRSSYLYKTLSDGMQIWWCINEQRCEIKTFEGKYSKIPFVPPYEVDEKRLKIFLLFS